MAARHPEIEFLKAPYLNDHPLVLDAFAERVEEILAGQNNMNCQLCKYREQVLGFEAEVGLAAREPPPPRRGHRHDADMHDHPHATATAIMAITATITTTIMTTIIHDHDHDHDHDHGHGHGHGEHGHHHPPHPHADHRHGPGQRKPEAGVRAGEARLSPRPRRDLSPVLRHHPPRGQVAHLPPDIAEIAVRLIHACGMIDIVERSGLHAGRRRARRAALANGGPILCDSSMVAAGIMRRRLPAANESSAARRRARAGTGAARKTTRSAAAVELWGERLAGAVVAIGNAPTALFRLLERSLDGTRPAAVLGFPVGFVGAAESKAALIDARLGIPFSP